MTTKTKKDLIENIVASTGIKYKVAALVVDSFLDELQEFCSSGDRIELRKFGVFSTVTTSPKTIVNVNNGQKMIIPVKKKIKFNPSKILNRKINEKK